MGICRIFSSDKGSIYRIKLYRYINTPKFKELEHTEINGRTNRHIIYGSRSIFYIRSPYR